MSDYAHVFNPDKSKRLITGLRDYNSVQLEFEIEDTTEAAQFETASFLLTIKKRSDCRYIPIVRTVSVYNSNMEPIFGKTARVYLESFGSDAQGNLTIDSAWAEANTTCKIIANFDILEIYE